jgi:tetratricopeptide (TPR) repeat protein
MSKSTLQYLTRSRRTAPDYYELTALVSKLGEPWTDEWEQLWRRAVEAGSSNAATEGKAPSVVALPVPAQLPADVPAFTGRAHELAELDRLHSVAREEASGEGPPAVVISALCGTAGVGKTALVTRWAHRVRHAFPDGQLYVNLRGYDPDQPMPAADALAGFLRALGIDGHDIPLTLDDRGALFRTVIDGRRILLILDNAATVEHVRPLIPGTGTCFTVVTSRDQLAGLVARDGARRIEVHPLTSADATTLLSALIGARVAGDPDAASALAERCARLPLALRVAAEYAVTRPGTPLADLVRELADEHRRLDLLDAGGDQRTVLRGVLSWSYRHLPADLARSFRLLGLHPGVSVGGRAAAALLGATPGRAQELLGQLSRAHLVHPIGADHYGMHDLLHTYAAELAEAVDSARQRRAAIGRVLDYYLYTAHAASLRLEPHRLPIALPTARPAISPDTFTGAAEALDWFTAELPVLLSAIEQAGRAGFDDHTWRLAWTLMTFCERRGHWREYADIQPSALAATQRLGDRSGQAHAHRCLARAYRWLDRHDDSYSHLLQALRLYDELADHAGQARTHLNLSIAVELQGHHEEAMRHDQLALDLFVAAGDRYGQGLALNQIGCDHVLLGDYRQAIVHCEQALALFREFADDSGQAATWDSLGSAHHGLGKHAQAIECYRKAVELYRQLGNRGNEADTLIHLAETAEATGDADLARRYWQHALDILDEMRHKRANEIRARLAAPRPPAIAGTG